jgi:hypothetical protein
VISQSALSGAHRKQSAWRLSFPFTDTGGFYWFPTRVIDSVTW